MSRQDKFLFMLRVPYFWLALASLGLAVFSIPGAVCLCMFFLQYGRCLYDARWSESLYIFNVSRRSHDPAPLLWAFSYLLAGVSFIAPILAAPTAIVDFLVNLALISSMALPLGAARSAMWSAKQDGSMVHVDYGFLVDSERIDAWLISLFVFGVVPAILLYAITLLTVDSRITVLFFAAVLTFSGSCYYLKNRTMLYILGIPSTLKIVGTFAPAFGLCLVLSGILAAIFKFSFWQHSPAELLDLSFSMGIPVTYLGARMIESKYKNTHGLIFTYRWEPLSVRRRVRSF